MKLFPTVEFDPGYFRKQDHMVPEIGDTNEEWSEYWRLCLADSGIHSVKSFEDSWYVELENIHDEALAALIFNHMDDYQDEDIPDDVSSFEGGLILVPDTGAYLWPNCCGRLGNVAEWFGACWSAPGEDGWIWIGHPELRFESLDSDSVKVIETTEPGGADTEHHLVLDRRNFAKQLDDVVSRLRTFERRVATSLSELGYLSVDQIAHKLVGLSDLEYGQTGLKTLN